MTRKYKQRGYREEEKRAPGRTGGGGPRPQSEGPRGRGLGAPTETVFRCARCGHGEPPSGDIGVSCPSCGSDLHTCTHCAEFDVSAPFECRQEIAERISGKATRNECDLFRPKLTQEFGSEVEAPSDAKAAFDDLFNF